MDISIHQQILDAVETYTAESAKFDEKGNSAAGTRARAALGDLAKLVKARRFEIQDVKNAKKGAK